MDRVHLGYVVAALAVLALLIQLAAIWLRRVGARQRARRRSQRAIRGEREAEALLEQLGYAIVDRQVTTQWTIACNGEEQTIELRADLLVQRDGQRLVAEVKTGAHAPRLSTPATRRQLLEYRMAYDVDGVLLVDAEYGRVMLVEFPLAAPHIAARTSWVTIVVALLTGAAMGIVAMGW